MKISPAAPNEVRVEAAEASVPAMPAEEAVAFADLVDWHRMALMKGDELAAQAYGALLKLLFSLKRVSLIGENRSGDVLQALTQANGAMAYLEDRALQRAHRRSAEAGKQSRLAEAIERERGKDEREVDRLVAMAARGEDDVAAVAADIGDTMSSNTDTRRLTPEQRSEEERRARERAETLQRRIDERDADAHAQRRREAGLMDADEEQDHDQQLEERAQATIEAEERLKARRLQGARNRAEVGGGDVAELTHDEVMARANARP